MAARITSAFEKEAPRRRGRHGTGKTLAYLVPAIDQASATNRRIIISTGTKNLQEQLMEKDIPFLTGHPAAKFSARYMKGRANYACLYRIHKSGTSRSLTGWTISIIFATSSIGRETKVGDRAELTYLPENLGFWNRINPRRHLASAKRCPDYEPCFITKMRARAENADIVIVNHHLFFADLAVRGNQFGKVIPDYNAVIFDEAHLIEDVCGGLLWISGLEFPH